MGRVEVALLWLGGAMELKGGQSFSVWEVCISPSVPVLLVSLGPQRVLTRSSKSD